MKIKIYAGDIAHIQLWPLLKIVRSKDYGPISKLFCSLMNEEDPNTIIVTSDDDLVYGEHWLERLIHHSERLPDAAVGFRGRLMSNSSFKYGHTKCITSAGIDKDIDIDIVTAVRGWAYRRSFFDSEFIDRWESVEKNHPYIFFNDLCNYLY